MMRIRSLVLAGVALLALTSCEDLFRVSRAGQAVTFSATSENGLVTKTEYSGYVSNGKERINWVDGDQVKIYMYSHKPSGKWEETNLAVQDYSVVNIQENGIKSSGKLAAPVEEHLVWLENKHHEFYSVYPADFEGSAEVDGNGARIKFTIPSTQSGDMAENMKYAYLAAVKEGVSDGDRGSVVLEYYPMVTTLYLTFENENVSKDPITIKGIRLSSKVVNWQQIPIAGTFTATVNNGKFVPDAENINENRAGSISLSMNSVLEHGPDKRVTCAIFLPPKSSYDPTALELTVLTSKEPLTISLQNSVVSSFEKCKKYNLTFGISETGINIHDLSNAALELIRCCHPIGNTWGSIENIRRLLEEDVDVQIAVKEWFATATTLSSQQGLQFIYDLDTELLSLFPNLTSISYLDLADHVSVNLDGMDNLTSASFNHGGSFVVKNCTNIDEFTTINNDAVILFEFENCPHLTEFATDNTGHKAVYKFNQMPALTRINVPDCKTMTVTNCPVLETITMVNAVSAESLIVEDAPVFKRFTTGNMGSIAELTLKNTPLFEGGSIENAKHDIWITLENCSTNISGTARIDFSNYNNTLKKKSIVNSDKVLFYCSGNQVTL